MMLSSSSPARVHGWVGGRLGSEERQGRKRGMRALRKRQPPPCQRSGLPPHPACHPGPIRTLARPPGSHCHPHPQSAPSSSSFSTSAREPASSAARCASRSRRFALYASASSECTAARILRFAGAVRGVGLGEERAWRQLGGRKKPHVARAPPTPPPPAPPPVPALVRGLEAAAADGGAKDVGVQARHLHLERLLVAQGGGAGGGGGVGGDAQRGEPVVGHQARGQLGGVLRGARKIGEWSGGAGGEHEWRGGAGNQQCSLILHTPTCTTLLQLAQNAAPRPGASGTLRSEVP